MDAIRLTGAQHAELQPHLFPGDGLEAAALLLCGRLQDTDYHALTARKIVLIPHDQCERTSVRVTWPTRLADQLIAEASRRQMAIVKIHSHPGGLNSFSECDDASDRGFFRSVSDLLEDGLSHASAVMLPEGEGRIFARTVTADGGFEPVSLVMVAGENLRLWRTDGCGRLPAFVRRHAQAFGSGTTDALRRMTIAVGGCSGTGSPTIEQLVRLGVGRLVLVDPDRVEWRNLNRIYMTSAADANLGRLKVDVLAEAIGRIGLGTEVTAIGADLATPRAVKAVASSDLVFGCLDSVSGRDLLSRLATFYNLPYIDVGVQLTALAEGGVDQITAAVHYLQPGLSSLRSRGVYSGDEVEAELLKRSDPDEYQTRLKEKYIRGVNEDRPAVISVNTLAASLAVNELLARLHGFRYDPNGDFAIQQLTLHDPHIYRTSERDLEPCAILAKEVGRGDVVPLLDRPAIQSAGEGA